MLLAAFSLSPAEFPSSSFGVVTTDAIADWVGLNVVVIPAIEKQTGPFASMPRNLALLPPVIIREAVKVAKITETGGQERLLAPVEAAQIGLVWRITRRKLSGGGVFVCGKEIEDGTHLRPRRRIRVHTRRCWTHYRLVSQLRRNHARTTRRRGNADKRAIIGIERESDRSTGFSLRRFRRFHTLRAENNQSSPFHPQPDGSWLAKEIPGPTNYQPWLYCWRVFRVACLMLKVAHEMPLDRYQQKIEKLATQWPTAWHLVCLAEDKCRFEHFNRLKSRIEFDISLGRVAPPLWDAGSPWSAIFFKAAEDDETYWDDNIRHPGETSETSPFPSPVGARGGGTP